MGITGSLPVCSAPPPPPLGCLFTAGDVDGDMTITIQDLILSIKVILEPTEVTEEAICAADVDSNGVVNVSVSDTHKGPPPPSFMYLN